MSTSPTLLCLLLVTACSVPRGVLPDMDDASRSDAGRGDAAPDALPLDAGTDTCAPVEDCNGFDDDCDGNIDETCPCVPGETQECGCDGMQNCVDGAWGECLGGREPSDEICNEEDDDCDGRVDEAPTDAEAQYADLDMDGFGDPAAVARSCTPVPNHVTVAGDCDDANPDANPDGTEVCDGAEDEDCDTLIDEGLGMTFHPDADGDGFGDESMPVRACTMPVGHVVDGTDCDDACEHCYPGFTGDVCADGHDNDCNGTVDGGGCRCRFATTPSGRYLVCDDITRSWAAARTYCMDRGGDLVSINSSTEQDDIWGIMQPVNEDFWIGGFDSGDDGSWEWVDGTGLADCEDAGSSTCTCLGSGFCSWRSGRPNGDNDDCAWIEKSQNGNWDDKQCNEGHRFICEF